MKNTNSVDCFKCRHFYITWDANQPRGCKAFGFKTKRLPSQVVLESSGEPCMKFSPKEEPPKKPPKTGWIA
ncbi:uracil-DNA glycosylase [Thiomicrorhabdus sp.]|uniref:uracil-DNA glycosylase n=1 Tax=Thiomicrorhabdus sp. TaxID=2039724 RepID=UPI00356971A6